MHPAIFVNAFLKGGVSEMLLLVVLAPPFIMVLGFCNVVFSRRAARLRASGPMSSFAYLQESEKKWKIMLASGIGAATNFLLMFITAVSR